MDEPDRDIKPRRRVLAGVAGVATLALAGGLGFAMLRDRVADPVPGVAAIQAQDVSKVSTPSVSVPSAKGSESNNAAPLTKSGTSVEPAPVAPRPGGEDAPVPRLAPEAPVNQGNDDPGEASKAQQDGAQKDDAERAKREAAAAAALAAERAQKEKEALEAAEAKARAEKIKAEQQAEKEKAESERKRRIEEAQNKRNSRPLGPQTTSASSKLSDGRILEVKLYFIRRERQHVWQGIDYRVRGEGSRAFDINYTVYAPGRKKAFIDAVKDQPANTWRHVSLGNTVTQSSDVERFAVQVYNSPKKPGSRLGDVWLTW